MFKDNSSPTESKIQIGVFLPIFDKMPRHVFEGLSYEIFDGPYDKKEIKDFSEWIKTSWGLEKISDIYNQLSEELE